jgi:hypothetical protein
VPMRCRLGPRPGTRRSSYSMKGCGGPERAGKLYAAARERVTKAMHEHAACYVNFFMSRKRSGCRNNNDTRLRLSSC